MAQGNSLNRKNKKRNYGLSGRKSTAKQKCG